VALEQALAEALKTEHVLLFPSGWGAGFGAIAALVRPDDYVILDHLAHACLHQGANAATNNVLRHEHRDLGAIEAHLKAIRARDTRNSILVVTEGLFSMDSDSPDIERMQTICHENGATLMVDVAHDFGALGPGGGGQLAIQSMLGKVDLVVGAFSKTFSSNGGFVATHSPAVRQYMKVFGGPHIFSNAISPVQSAVVIEALRIVRSAEGDALRNQLMNNINMLRHALAVCGITCLGDPSPIVPAPIGSEKVARTASGILGRRGVFANLVEFPAVGIGSARFRLQVMSGHTSDHIRTAAEQVVEAIHEARMAMGESEPVYAVVNQRP
jgi:glycine C-acetyltransferase